MTEPTTRRSRGLKLFVWKDVLCDWSCGMVCVLAHNVEEARKLYYATSYENGELDDEPEVVTEPKAFSVYGGG